MEFQRPNSDGVTELGEIVLRYVPLPVARILDIGCGSAELVRAYAYAGSPLAVGLDLKDAFDRNGLRRSEDGEHLIVGDGCHLPFRESAFDATFLINTLHRIHQHRHRDILGEIRRALIPGGTCLVIESLCEGPAFEITRQINDETTAITAAQVTLSQMNAAEWKMSAYCSADIPWRIADLAALRAHYRRRSVQLKAIGKNSENIDRMIRKYNTETSRDYLLSRVGVWCFEKV
jgi:SAM-dependent methyltransferase